MSAPHAPWRTTVLTYSRAAGIVLAIAIVAFAVTAVALGRQWEGVERDRGRVHARAFIAKVRACRRGTIPRPSWNECELRVQDAE